ncbi:unnamed protein product [Rotaria sp. Silwood1]|nr:unnamed protein product [Rotaria sp. Silwood1]CAF4731443.1 unnamed protein product [Rotaria sp. Silwood1]
MSMTKTEKHDDAKLYKEPFSISQLIMGLLFGTYFLTVQTIELSLSTYVLQENKFDLYRDYLIFKGQAPIWKWWQLVSSIIIPLSIITAVRNIFQIFTKKSTTRRNIIDIVTALQLFGILYTVFTSVLPLEKKLIQTVSKHNIHKLNFLHWIIFLSNILGWFIPIFRYQDWKNDERLHPKKKIE